ncbi:MAG: 16S rRNA (cytosine(967)-C(5))-methyltransferase RsmB [Acutalibacteraceae bacterium]|jgi:16S rRNA (cytosine967-C5)-methyltransferase
MDNPRKVAALVLQKIERDGAFSNLTLAEQLKNRNLTDKDKALVSALVYGVLDRKITLDYVLSRFVKTPIEKTAPFTLQVLRTALYQIMYMDKIPESAAVNEAVKLVKNSKESRNSGFVNGVLRSVLRTQISLPEGEDINSLKVRYSCPEWIINSFVKDYGLENTKAILAESLKTPPLTVRVNTLVCDLGTIKREFENQGVSFSDGICQNSLDIHKGIDITKNELYINGSIFVQDAASQSAIAVLAPKPGERVLDMCAAPGGKSFTMACLMENKGEIVACDLHPHRVELIEKSAERLQIKIIKTKVADATVFDQTLGKFDCILCDVPCSGLGVMRRKPDIKYNKEHDFKELEQIQYKILTNAAKYLKKCGRILYSTCTLRKAENENLVIRFQKEYNNFHKKYEHTFMTHLDGTDGFYCALLTDSKN